jgi:hypothetical protein
LKGTIVNQVENGWLVRGARTATKITPPVHILKAESIVTGHVKHRDREPVLEAGHGNGLCVPVAESLLRRDVAADRIGLTETQVLQAAVMLELRRRTLRSLAATNRISASVSDFDWQELNSEYVVATLAALRATSSSATDAEIREFKSHLAGETTDSRIMMQIGRTSRTTAIRYLKRRAEYHHQHVDISDYSDRLTA